jgi:competence protein ComEC
MRAPLVGLAVCIGLGGLIGGDLDCGSAAIVLCMGAALAALAAAAPSPRAAQAALAFAALGVGAAAAAVEERGYERAGLAAIVREDAAAGRPVQLEGVVAGDVQTTPDRAIFLLDVTHVILQGERRPAPGRARVLVSGRAGLLRAAEGDPLAVWAVLRPPRRYGTVGAFDSIAHARREGVHATAHCKSPLLVQVLRSGAGQAPGLVVRARRWARATLAAVVPPGPEQGLVRAMVLGDRAGIDRKTAEAFRVAGTYHVLALSGAQVALIAGAMLVLLRRLPGSPLWSAVACSSAVASYALFVGAETPVVRAAWMAVVLLLGKGLDLDADALNLLALAAGLLLVHHPAAIRDAGFQLSFAATAGIVLLAPVMVGPPPVRLAALRWAIAGSLAAQAALLPLLASEFHRAAPAAVALNLVAGPLASGVLLAGFATLLAAAVLPALGPALGELAWTLAHFLLRSGRVVEGAPFLDVRLPTPSAWAIGVYVLGLVLVVRDGTRRRGLALTALAAVAMLAGKAGPPVDGRLHLTALDVGQGDALVLVSPRSGRALLVDAGFAGERHDAGESVVAPYLWESGIHRLDALAITHAHPDHAGGAPFLLRHFRIDEAWEGIAAAREPAYRAFAVAAARNGVERLALRRGFSRSWDGVQIDVLSPAPAGRSPGVARNDDSLVLGIRYGSVRLLLTGDIEALAERALPRFPAEVLKVAHHGSRTSSTETFLRSASPGLGVISVGSGGVFSHPHPEALARLRGAGVRVLRTDRDGSVTVSTDGSRIWVRTWAEGRERRVR